MAAADPWATDPSCAAEQAEALTQIAAIHPAATILSDDTAFVVPLSLWQTQFAALLAAIAGPKSIIGDISRLRTDPTACLATHPTAVQQCSAGLTPMGDASGEVGAAAAAHVLYVNPRPWLCAHVCSPVIGRFLAYWSNLHVSTQYASYLSGVVGAALKKVLR